MSHTALRLVTPDPADPDILRFEQRRAQRRTIRGRVTSLQKSGSPASCSNRISSLELADISATGLGGIVQQPVTIGTSITVFFPPPGSDHGSDRYGHVTRCTRCEQGYRIGVRLIAKTAA